MGKKKDKEDKALEEAEVELTADDIEGKRIKDVALQRGVIARNRRLCTKNARPSKVLTKANGKDIVKRSSTRKNRFLVIMPGKLAPAAAGTLGSLANQDSRNPILYMDFPEGRLKFFGTITYPDNKYISLNFGSKNIVCEDVFDSMIVFSEAWWVGTKVENPEERKLPLPASLQAAKHKDVTFTAGASGPETGSLPTAAGGSKPGRAGAGGGDGGSQGEADDDDLEEITPSQMTASQRPKRAAVSKRKSYAVDSDASDEDGEEDGEDDDDDEGGGGGEKPEPSDEDDVMVIEDDPTPAPSQKSKGKAPAAGGTVLDMLRAGAKPKDAGGAKEEAKKATKKETKKATTKKKAVEKGGGGTAGAGAAAAKKKRKVIVSSDDDDDDESDGGGDDESDEVVELDADEEEGLTQSRRSSGRAKSSVKYRESDAEEEDDEEESDGGGDDDDEDDESDYSS